MRLVYSVSFNLILSANFLALTNRRTSSVKLLRINYIPTVIIINYIKFFIYFLIQKEFVKMWVPRSSKDVLCNFLNFLTLYFIIICIWTELVSLLWCAYTHLNVEKIKFWKLYVYYTYGNWYVKLKFHTRGKCWRFRDSSRENIF